MTHIDITPPDMGRISPAACGACALLPSAQDVANAIPQKGRLMLSIPTAHCAACISTIENGLADLPHISSVRVNLTQKRVVLEGDDHLDIDPVINRLACLGYEAHELDPGLLSATQTDSQGRDLLMRLGVAGFAMMNIMLLSVAVWSGADAATRDLFHWLSGAIALPTVLFSGKPFFKSAFAALRHGRLGMDVPISLALILASAISLYETSQSGHHAYFDAAVMLAFFLLAGRYLDHRTRAIARSAAEELAALEVPRATVLRDGVEESCLISEIAVGDLVRVRPGGRMPVDGTVMTGTSEIDRALITGETLPAWAGPGTKVCAGEINLTGPLILQVTAAGRNSSLHRMADLVAIAEHAKTRYTSLAERAARLYSPLVHLLSFTAFGVWMWKTGGDVRTAINISAAVLIITCPCALGLAVPAVVTAASGKLFRKGLLIKDGTALERLAEVDRVVFDKTGTLTLGTPVPTNLSALPQNAVQLAMGLAAASSHPLAMALFQAGQQAGLTHAHIEDIQEKPGYGLTGIWQGHRLRLGRADWCGAVARDQSATYLRMDDDPAIAFLFEDCIRPGAVKTIAALQEAGIKVTLLSGDSEGAVRAFAAKMQISDWHAGCLPAQKAAFVQDLTAQGHRVLMVGDGLNDTAALAGAHVSISPATALDAARTASDIVLLGQDMTPIFDAWRIARQSTQRIKENFAVSALYNVVAVPLALIGMATPLAAALAMSLSSITVSLNALRLR